MVIVDPLVFLVVGSSAEGPTSTCLSRLTGNGTTVSLTSEALGK